MFWIFGLMNKKRKYSGCDTRNIQCQHRVLYAQAIFASTHTWKRLFTFFHRYMSDQSVKEFFWVPFQPSAKVFLFVDFNYAHCETKPNQFLKQPWKVLRLSPVLAGLKMSWKGKWNRCFMLRRGLLERLCSSPLWLWLRCSRWPCTGSRSLQRRRQRACVYVRIHAGSYTRSGLPTV